MNKFRVRSSEFVVKQPKKFGITALVVITLTMLLGFTAPASAMLTAKANHDHITIDFFYHGSTVSVRGESDPGVDLIIKVTSPEGHQVLKQKGKVGGLLWMNVGQLKFEQTPNFYAVYSTRKLDEMLNKEEEKAKWFDEFVKYKEESRVYASSFGKIETKMNAQGHQEYYILTDWPYQAAPGDYVVAVYAVKNGKVVEQAESKVNVEQIGVVKTLATMAKNSAAFYGLLSIGIALGAGFGVGLVFRKGGGSH
jgi:hypothetical protein